MPRVKRDTRVNSIIVQTAHSWGFQVTSSAGFRGARHLFRTDVEAGGTRVGVDGRPRLRRRLQDCGLFALEEGKLAHNPLFSLMNAFIRSANCSRRSCRKSLYRAVAHNAASVGTHWLRSVSSPCLATMSIR